MNDRKRLTRSKTTAEYSRNRAALVSFILILMISGSELACRCTESELICRTIYSGENGSHRGTDSDEILGKPVQKIWICETLIDRIKLSGKASRVICRRFKKKGNAGRTISLDLPNCDLWFWTIGRLYNSRAPIAICFWL